MARFDGDCPNGPGVGDLLGEPWWIALAISRARSAGWRAPADRVLCGCSRASQRPRNDRAAPNQNLNRALRQGFGGMGIAGNSFLEQQSPAAIRGWVRTRGFPSQKGATLFYDWLLAGTWMPLTAGAAVYYFAPLARLLGA